MRHPDLSLWPISKIHISEHILDLGDPNLEFPVPGVATNRFPVIGLDLRVRHLRQPHRLEPPHPPRHPERERQATQLFHRQYQPSLPPQLHPHNLRLAHPPRKPRHLQSLHRERQRRHLRVPDLPIGVNQTGIRADAVHAYLGEAGELLDGVLFAPS